MLTMSVQGIHEGLLMAVARYIVGQERSAPPPSIRLCVSAAHSKRDMEKAAQTLKTVVTRILKRK